MLKKLLARLEEEAHKYALEAISKPSKRDAFEYGVHHGVLKGIRLAEQWLEEELKEEEDDDSE